MSGHSKWSDIKRSKGASDSNRTDIPDWGHAEVSDKPRVFRGSEACLSDPSHQHHSHDDDPADEGVINTVHEKWANKLKNLSPKDHVYFTKKSLIEEFLKDI